MTIRNIIRHLIEEILISEFKEDLKKQCIVLMGIPAAGKSTFINNEIKKYFPGFSGYKISSSDIQLQAAQYQHAKNQFEYLQKNIKSETDILKFIEHSKYINNDGNEVKIPLTYDWWLENSSKGLKHFYKTFFKPFYATYFDIRDLAQATDQQLFKTKIVQAGNIIIIDTTAGNYKKVLARLEKTKEQDFTNNIIYLEIDPKLSIQRDKYRKETQGRGVGESTILGISKLMDAVHSEYKKDGNSLDGVVDRILHFKWKQSGNSPINGQWKMVSDVKYYLKRKLKKSR